MNKTQATIIFMGIWIVLLLAMADVAVDSIDNMVNKVNTINKNH